MQVISYQEWLEKSGNPSTEEPSEVAPLHHHYKQAVAKDLQRYFEWSGRLPAEITTNDGEPVMLHTDIKTRQIQVSVQP